MAKPVRNGAVGDPTGWSPTTPAALLAAPGYLVRRMYQAYVGAWVRQVDSELTGPQFAVLVALEENPGLDQGSLAAAVALDRSTMADIARRMEEKGLIVRLSDVHDGRRKLLHLTPNGREALLSNNRRARELDEQLLAGLDASDRVRVMTMLLQLSESWSDISTNSD